MTATICDPWIERLIAAGQLAPGARGLTRADAAAQYNEVNALDPSDDDYLYAPDQASVAARDVLALVGIEIADGARIMLTDAMPGPRCWAFLVEPSQVEYACEQHRLVTGESLSADAIERGLPWA